MFKRKFFYKLLCLLLVGMLIASASYANVFKSLYSSTGKLLSSNVPSPFYVGISAGYGDPTWDELAAPDDIAAQNSVPSEAKSGNIAGGFFLGYEFSRHFALEASYIKFHNVNLHFVQPAILNIYNIGPAGLKTKTETYNFYGKFLVPFGLTSARAYASAGATDVHRYDVEVGNLNKIMPNFGVGIIYDVTKRILVDFGFFYSVGYGKSSARPVDFYAPFTYFLHCNVGFRL